MYNEHNFINIEAEATKSNNYLTNFTYLLCNISREISNVIIDSKLDWMFNYTY